MRLRFISYKHDKTVLMPLQLAMSGKKNMLRLAGGCGYMNSTDSNNLEVISNAIKSCFSGILFSGGTRMIERVSKSIVPGITEIASNFKNDSEILTVGIVPRTDIIQYDGQIIVSDHKKDTYITYLNPDFDESILLQFDVDEGSNWDQEYRYNMYLMGMLLQQVENSKSLHLFYNGGKTTENELLDIAKKGWPVLLIKDSGRITEQYANNNSFLKQYPNVVVCDLDEEAISAKVKSNFINN